MKTLFILILLNFMVGSAFAAELMDVKLLDVTYKKSSFLLKLQVKDGPKDSYFNVEIVQEDQKALEKMALVLQKMKQKENFKLDLNIPSFSVSPSGSYYRSLYVTFLGTPSQESLMVK